MMPWSRAFADPIPLPGRKPIRTLRDAGDYIASLPKAERDLPHWQDAAEALMLVAEGNGPTMLARIGMMRAINHGKVVEREPRRKAVRAYKIIT